MNVNLPNGWGIVRTIADLALKQPEGKYVLMRDPNKVSLPQAARSSDRITDKLSLLAHLQPLIKLFRVPADLFDGGDEDEEGFPSVAPSDDGL